MNRIYVASGVGVAPTELASYDAALADANLHNYNLVRVSSIVPAGAAVERVDRAPDLGAAGNRLTVVESRITAPPDDDRELAAGLGWATGPGPGLFYEATDRDAAAVRETLEAGLDAGSELREWDLPDREFAVTTATPAEDAWTTAVTVAAYGDSEPMRKRAGTDT